MNTELRQGWFGLLNNITVTGGNHYVSAVFANEPIYPYTVTSVVTAIRKGDTKNYRDEISLQLNGYGNTIAQLEALKTQFDELLGLDENNIAMTDYKLIDISLEFDRGVVQLEQNVYQFTQQYKVIIEHN